MLSPRCSFTSRSEAGDALSKHSRTADQAANLAAETAMRASLVEADRAVQGA